jgi:hypothetical protein
MVSVRTLKGGCNREGIQLFRVRDRRQTVPVYVDATRGFVQLFTVGHCQPMAHQVRLTGAVGLTKEMQNEPNRLSHVDVRLRGSLPATSLPATKDEQH